METMGLEEEGERRNTFRSLSFSLLLPSPLPLLLYRPIASLHLLSSFLESSYV